MFRTPSISMRSPFPPGRSSIRTVGVGLAVTALLLAACGGDSPASVGPTTTMDPAMHAHHHVSTANGQPDRIVAGPQGRVPQFVIECGLSHMAQDDPIVHPGQPGASHLHTFFGNTTTGAFSTPDALLAGASTCDPVTDRAAYWAPALLRDGAPVEPSGFTAYYRAGPDVDPTTVVPYPTGLEMIAGDSAATAEQPVSVVAWTCGSGSDHRSLPPDCASPTKPLHLMVTFPDCWDGEHLRSDDHVGHVAYSAAGSCPASHPVPVPQLQLSIEYPVSGSVDGLELASGGLLTGHADFVNAWEPDALEAEVTNCLHRLVVCGVRRG
jgi:Domain of unknown function (DUF1996)